MAFREEQIVDPQPGSTGGLIEAVKTGVIVALRKTLTGTSMSNSSNRIHVEMDYPMVKEKYPGIWVQFSLASLQPSGMGMVLRDPESGDRLQQFMYRGRVTIVVVALSSIERDRISDFLISMLSFSRIPDPRLFTENGVQENFSDLYAELDANPHLSMTVNSDQPTPGGQSVTVGVPWNPNELAYEDAYSFEVVGEFQLLTSNEGLHRLRRVDVLPEIGMHGTYRPGDWV